MSTADSDIALELVQTLSYQPWCYKLPLESLVELARDTEVLSFFDGDTILAEGTVSDALYFVLRGTLEVSKRDDSGVDRPLARLEQGAVFGEMSFLDGLEASATVRARGAVKIGKLTRERVVDPATEAVLVSSLAVQVVKRLRAIDGNYAESVRARSTERKKRKSQRRFFAVTAAALALSQLVFFVL